jgi:hypothetical protein
MKLLPTTIVLTSLVCSGAAFADIDCSDPIDQWKPRETLRQEVERNGWTVQRIKVDDGCYEVRAVDRDGNKLKAKYSPATLKIRGYEIEFRSDAETSFSPGRKRHAYGQKHDQ